MQKTCKKRQKISQIKLHSGRSRMGIKLFVFWKRYHSIEMITRFDSLDIVPAQ